MYVLQDGDHKSLAVLEIMSKRRFGRFGRDRELTKRWASQIIIERKLSQRIEERCLLSFEIVISNACWTRQTSSQCPENSRSFNVNRRSQILQPIDGKLCCSLYLRGGRPLSNPLSEVERRADQLSACLPDFHRIDQTTFDKMIQALRIGMVEPVENDARDNRAQ